MLNCFQKGTRFPGFLRKLHGDRNSHLMQLCCQENNSALWAEMSSFFSAVLLILDGSHETVPMNHNFCTRVQLYKGATAFR